MVTKEEKMVPKNNKKKAPMTDEIDINTIYQEASNHWIHAEQIRWTLMYNILTANSILILAWAALSATEGRFYLLQIGSSLLCITGILLNIVWICLQLRSNSFTDSYSKYAIDLAGC
jgi:hypothetical protein